MAGWIKLHRQIRENWTWEEKPYSKGQAWIDLILSANHEDRKVPLGNEVYDVKRGSFITSELKLMNRWGWSKTKVRAFLKLLQNDSMILQKKDSKKTTLTITNYSDYQDKETEEEPQKDQKKTAKKPQKNTNKNEKNEKNIKNTYAEFVTMTNAEYEKLVSTYGEEFTKQCIAVLDNYKGQNNKKYACDYRAILNWVVDKVKNQGTTKQKYQPQKTLQQQNLDTMKEWLQEEEANDKARVMHDTSDF